MSAPTSATAAVVLAAGSASRFGGQKLLAPFGDAPLVRRVVENVLASSVDRVFVVLGEDEADVWGAVEALPVTAVRNLAYREGMASSIRAGIAALPDTVEWALVVLGDQPGVKPEQMDRILRAGAPGRLVVAPVYEGCQGNPVLFHRLVFPELRTLEGDRGARSVVERDPDRVFRLDMDAPMPTDVDTPEDLRRMLAAENEVDK